jgi:hypothetical protein
MPSSYSTIRTAGTLPSPSSPSRASIEILDWVDEYEGIVLSPTVWIKSEVPLSSTSTILAEMGHLAQRFSGDVIEAGLQFPPNF